MLLDRLRNERAQEPRRVLVPNEFIVRPSIGPGPAKR
jgi:LacI family transcriptional regulator